MRASRPPEVQPQQWYRRESWFARRMLHVSRRQITSMIRNYDNTCERCSRRRMNGIGHGLQRYRQFVAIERLGQEGIHDRSEAGIAILAKCIGRERDDRRRRERMRLLVG